MRNIDRASDQTNLAGGRMADKKDIRDYFVYAISAESKFLKFGVSGNLLSRFETIQGSCPLALDLVASIGCLTRADAYDLERKIHIALKPHRVRGEWFKSCPRTLAVVEFLRRKDVLKMRAALCDWARNLKVHALDGFMTQTRGDFTAYSR